MSPVKVVTTSNKKRKEPEISIDEDDLTKEDLEKELLETREKLTEREKRLLEAEALVESLKAKLASKEDDDDDVSDDGDDSVVGNDPWSLSYLQLREYRMINGNCSVTKATNPRLQTWIHNQKCAYANVKSGKKGNKISPEKILKLEGIGFSWGKKHPKPPSWESQFEELQKYQKAMRTCNISIHPTNPSPLAKWVLIQRSEYKRFKKGTGSLLTLEQIGQLKEIGFKWKAARAN
jgi:Helicase associated domain